MQSRSSNENCLSIHLSVKWVICNKTKESCAHILMPHERPFTLVLWEEEWLVRGWPLLPEILGKPAPANWQLIIFLIFYSFPISSCRSLGSAMGTLSLSVLWLFSHKIACVNSCFWLLAPGDVRKVAPRFRAQRIPAPAPQLFEDTSLQQPPSYGYPTSSQCYLVHSSVCVQIMCCIVVLLRIPSSRPSPRTFSQFVRVQVSDFWRPKMTVLKRSMNSNTRRPCDDQGRSHFKD